MTSRTTTITATGLTALAIAAALTACAPTPEPTPTPTGFASEAEAFAAAEATYRAYVDALNEVDLSDPDTFEPVFALTTGDLNATDREGLSRYHAEGVSVAGTSTALLIEPRSVDLPAAMQLAVCLDVSSVTLTAPDGSSLVDVDRVDVQSLLITLEALPDHSAWRLADIEGRAGAPTC
ncbi:hypothetical protein [Microbacterium xanthum]|uniref:hypothetical protein n=1 Tax=Microbacterium xanthum TaxID=3079794 RepID=UPI002AD1F43B|nr:hypothetical protein [Microbacterium sp. KSW-48]MDZ8172557.1 hypothetical protein [Microbacterium sp. KSW-48]